MCVSLL